MSQAREQVELLSSLAAIVFHSSGVYAGRLAESMGWAPYYTLTMLAGLPALAIMFHLRRRLGTAAA